MRLYDVARTMDPATGRFNATWPSKDVCADCMRLEVLARNYGARLRDEQKKYDPEQAEAVIGHSAHAESQAERFWLRRAVAPSGWLGQIAQKNMH